MKKKESKAEFKCMMSHFNVLARKFCDVWFCQYSHRQQYKSDALPDHMIVRCGQSYFVEIKQSNEHWNFASRNGAGIRDIQRRTLDDWEKEHNPCWLFLILGAGRVPYGHSAWLMPWSEWKKTERKLIESNQKPLRRGTKQNIGALDLLYNWNVVFSKNIAAG